MSVFISAFVLLLAGGPAPESRAADFVKQIETVDRMDRLRSFIELYREDHGVDPPSLETLGGAFKMPEDATIDGWSRSFYYFTTGKSYLLISFGRGGRPATQTSDPGGISKRRDFDTNIVMIDGRWAQTPIDVDR